MTHNILLFWSDEIEYLYDVFGLSLYVICGFLGAENACSMF